MSHTCKICGGEHWPNQPVYLLDCYQRGYARLKTEVAAAEERGRRAGIEEGFRRGVENAAQWLKISEPLRLAMHRALSDHAALAPRDSGKGTT